MGRIWETTTIKQQESQLGRDNYTDSNDLNAPQAEQITKGRAEVEGWGRGGVERKGS